MLYFLTRISALFLTAMESRALRETQAAVVVASTMQTLNALATADTSNSLSETQTTFSNNSSAVKTLLLRFSTMILGATFSAEAVIKEANSKGNNRKEDRIRLEWAEASLTTEMTFLEGVLAVDRACSNRWAVWGVRVQVEEVAERKASAHSSHLARVAARQCQGQVACQRKLLSKMGVRWHEPKRRRLIGMGTRRPKLLRSQTMDAEIARKTNLWSKEKLREEVPRSIKWLEMEDNALVAPKAIKSSRALANITIGE